MLANNISVLLINFIITVVFIFISKYQERTHIIALIYAAVSSVVELTQSVSFPVLLIAFIANFLISFALFKILKRLEGGLLYILIAIVGCLVLWYASYLPIGYTAFHSYKELGIIGK